MTAPTLNVRLAALSPGQPGPSEKNRHPRNSHGRPGADFLNCGPSMSPGPCGSTMITEAAIRATYSVVLTLIAWELIGRYVITSKLMFAPVSAIFAAFVNLASTGELQRHVAVSFTALGIGFALAAVAGIALGSLIAISRAVSEHLDPLINALCDAAGRAVAHHDPGFRHWPFVKSCGHRVSDGDFSDPRQHNRRHQSHR